MPCGRRHRGSMPWHGSSCRDYWRRDVYQQNCEEEDLGRVRLRWLLVEPLILAPISFVQPLDICHHRCGRDTPKVSNGTRSKVFTKCGCMLQVIPVRGVVLRVPARPRSSALGLLWLGEVSTTSWPSVQLCWPAGCLTRGGPTQSVGTEQTEPGPTPQSQARMDAPQGSTMR